MIKRPVITKEEIIADAIYLFVAMIVSVIAIFIFDIHWSLYPGETVFPPSRHIFQTSTPYYVAASVGGLIGFFLLKMLSFALMEEERAHGYMYQYPKSKRRPMKTIPS